MLPSSSRILAEAIYFDIFANISFLPIHLCTWQNQFFLYFWTLVSRRNGKKKNITNQNTDLRTLRNGFTEL